MAMNNKGQQAEQACCDYLLTRGLRLVERNYRCKSGEIDLVMRDGDTLVFIEVRFRSSERYGGALCSIDHRKRYRIMATTQHYLQNRKVSSAVRIDVVGMSPASDNSGYRFDWLQDAIRAD